MEMLKTAVFCLGVLTVAVHGAATRHKRQLVSPIVDHCPNGAVRHDNSCYYVSHELTNWPDALVLCEAYAGHLAFVESEREQLFLTQHLANVGNISTDPDHYFWIGGLDALTEGEWFWAKTLKPVTYTNWRPGEPNNNHDHQNHHQDCLAMYVDGQWDDGWCETQHNFICEIELGESEVIVG